MDGTNDNNRLGDRLAYVLSAGVEAPAIFSFRADPRDGCFTKSRGDIVLPERIGQVGEGALCTTLMLGPDEWLILSRRACLEQVQSCIVEAAGQAAFSLVDVSDRYVEINIEGEDASDIVAMGCASDPSTIGLPGGRRALMHGVQVILVRHEPDQWAVLVERSYASFLSMIFEEASHAAPCRLVDIC